MYQSSNISVNQQGHLMFAGMDTVELAQRYGTPLYLMDEARIRERCRLYRRAMSDCFGGDSMPLYASKVLSVKRMYEIMREERMGIDIVSCGELYTALQAGYDLTLSYFHGNNKTDEDIRYAISCGVGTFVCDGEDELRAIARIAAECGVTQRVMLRITPGIDPHTFAAVNTGKVDSKFGAAIETGQADELVGLALTLPQVDVVGYHCHIGSQIFDSQPFIDAADIMVSFIRSMKEKYGYTARELNLGGGMGVKYTNDQPDIDYGDNIRRIAQVLRERCEAAGIDMPKVLMEPGRSIVADAGITLYTVGSVKEIPGFKRYVSVDGGMGDNPRYALYQSVYDAVVANRAHEAADYVCTLAGRCCESGDLIGEDMHLARPVRGDLVAVFVTGAYNYSMASNYNRIPRPPVVMLRDGESYVAVERESFADLIRNDR